MWAVTDRTGSDYLLSAVESEGASTLFGLVGEGNAHLVDRLHESGLEYRYARHEQVGVTMADGYARTTGDVGVCTLTHGPGLTNGVTGLASADRDSVPLVVIVGDTSVAGRETSLQYLDHLGVADPVSVYGTRVESTGTLPETTRRAFAKARERSGPVVLEVPTDVQEGPAPAEPYEPKRYETGRVRPDAERIEAAAAVLDDADRPLILAGGGAAASGADGAIATLAERLGAPVATTFYAKALLPDHPLCTGIAGTFMTPASAELVPETDAVLAVGAQLSGKTTRYGDLYADAAVVQVDVDREALGRHRDVDVAILGDARETVGALTERVSPAERRAERLRERLRAADDPADLEFETEPDRVDPRALTVAVSRVSPPETVVTVDSGNNTGFPAVFHDVGRGGRMLVNGNFGAMGYSLPAALGAAAADPDRPVVCYAGDGSLMQVLGDLETAVRYDLGVVVVIYNDASYGIIRHRQHLDYGRETGASYGSPDFAAVAEGLGARGLTVRSLEDLEPVERHLAEGVDEPLVVDARTVPEVARPGFPPY
ncbi:acetolactate synthase [Halobacteriales archaeon QS_5_70_15]|nr:MAG: acetolactate synthase [Halobacteriales archaeon QS_5_70_15]